MYRPAMLMHRLTMLMHRLTMLMHRLTMLMHRLTMPMYRLTMLLHRLTIALHRLTMPMHRLVKIGVAEQWDELGQAEEESDSCFPCIVSVAQMSIQTQYLIPILYEDAPNYIRNEPQRAHSRSVS